LYFLAIIYRDDHFLIERQSQHQYRLWRGKILTVYVQNRFFPPRFTFTGR
jgi:hypothetical protein